MAADAGSDDNATWGVLLDHLSTSGLGGEEDTVDVNVEELGYRMKKSQHLFSNVQTKISKGSLTI